VSAPPERVTPRGWFVCHRADGKLRGRFEGPLEGPDAALALLKHLVEIELLLLVDLGRATSIYRIDDAVSITPSLAGCSSCGDAPC
jgi:hypothetical protein